MRRFGIYRIEADSSFRLLFSKGGGATPHNRVLQPHYKASAARNRDAVLSATATIIAIGFHMACRYTRSALSGILPAVLVPDATYPYSTYSLAKLAPDEQEKHFKLLEFNGQANAHDSRSRGVVPHASFLSRFERAPIPAGRQVWLGQRYRDGLTKFGFKRRVAEVRLDD